MESADTIILPDNEELDVDVPIPPNQIENSNNSLELGESSNNNENLDLNNSCEDELSTQGNVSNFSGREFDNSGGPSNETETNKDMTHSMFNIIMQQLQAFDKKFNDLRQDNKELKQDNDKIFQEIRFDFQRIDKKLDDNIKSIRSEFNLKLEEVEGRIGEVSKNLEGRITENKIKIDKTELRIVNLEHSTSQNLKKK